MLRTKIIFIKIVNILKFVEFLFLIIFNYQNYQYINISDDSLKILRNFCFL